MNGLLRTIEAEADAVSRFVALLKQEQVALGNGDIDKLTGFTQEKSSVASELTSLANQRNSALSGLGLAADRPGIEAWFKQQPPDKRTLTAWSQIMTLAVEARELNRVNGELIRIRMQHNAAALEAMHGASRTLHLYGPDGQSAPTVTRRINDAA